MVVMFESWMLFYGLQGKIFFCTYSTCTMCYLNKYFQEEDEVERVESRFTRPVVRLKFTSFDYINTGQKVQVNLEDDLAELWWTAKVERKLDDKQGIRISYPQYPLDTSVINEIKRVRPDVRFLGWVDRRIYKQYLQQYSERLYISYGLTSQKGAQMCYFFTQDKYYCCTLVELNYDKATIEMEDQQQLQQVPLVQLRPRNEQFISSYSMIRVNDEVDVFIKGQTRLNSNETMYWQQAVVVEIRKGEILVQMDSSNHKNNINNCKQTISVKSLEELRKGYVWVGGVCGCVSLPANIYEQTDALCVEDTTPCQQLSQSCDHCRCKNNGGSSQALESTEDGTSTRFIVQ
eukprot:TRINITY_DN73337_c0_g1_i2.p1 TRINITY_DN73337_c0_g1~~TRINITY_DN73337_c0_g1_i2.p1  ORF type:complete len:347 (-),score=21.58 TRINITY_DN73337_c0_g1_i2:239-1279(-)